MANTVQKVSAADYRRAIFMINNITSFAPAKSSSALAIIRTAEKIIMLYHLQNKGNTPATDIRNMENIIRTHQQNVEMFFTARAQNIRTK